MQLYDYSTGGVQAHKAYNKAHKDKKLDKKTHREIITALNGEIADFILETGKPFKLAHGLGTIQAKKRPPAEPKLDKNGVMKTFRPVDWPSTIKMWEKDPKTKEDKKFIFYRNLHTNGYTVSLYWEATKYMSMHKYWEFEFARDFNRKIAPILINIPNSLDRYLNVK